MTILFILFMAFLIKFAPKRFYYVFALIFGVAVQMGYHIGIIGLIVWMGLAKVANDLFYAARRG